MDSEVLIASSFQGRHVLGVLRVPLQRLGNAIPFDEILDWDRSSVEALDGVLKTIDDRVRRPSRIKLFKTVPLNLLDKRGVERCRALIPLILNLSASAIFPKCFVNAPVSLSRCGTNATQS